MEGTVIDINVNAIRAQLEKRSLKREGKIWNIVPSFGEHWH